MFCEIHMVDMYVTGEFHHHSSNEYMAQLSVANLQEVTSRDFRPKYCKRKSSLDVIVFLWHENA